MKAALDTNVLAYAEGINDARKQQVAIRLLQVVGPEDVVIPVQALGELFNVLVRKAKRPASEARAAILSWQDTHPVVDTSGAVLASASDLSTAHQLSIWDAVMVAAAAEADCRLLLSEDLQEGFTWRGVTVVNPFVSNRHPLLESLLD